MSTTITTRAGIAPPSPERLLHLRPYVVDLRHGRFSDDGLFRTTPQDVDAIFAEHLPAFADAHPGGPVRIVVYAHGGLVNEATGLGVADRMVDWWLDNGVYPIHVVWETGVLDALQQAVAGLVGRRELEARDIWDHTLDPVVETTIRPLGTRVWQSMKQNAEASSAAGGGARHTAERLAEFCRGAGREVQVHAVGHSAGAIFHAHFVPAAIDAGVPAFSTVQFLAPALRVDAFKQRLMGRLGSGVRDLTVYTMRRELERADDCIGVYHKSILYLVQRALEPGASPQILGLEDALTRDAQLRATLLGGPHARVVWSVSGDGAGDARSTSRSHGGFDDDRPTMTSVLLRVLGRRDAAGLVRELPVTADAQPVQAVPAPAPATAPAGKRRRALCVGINDYPAPNQLGGCVDDALRWSKALKALGFQTEELLDGEATLAGIVGRLREMIRGASPGDVLVYQYSGHGTQVADLDGDERDGRDEAACPVDFDEGHLLLDDDLHQLIAELPEGVHLTTFSDSCHSGSQTRDLVEVTRRMADAGPGRRRPRAVVASAELKRRHAEFRAAGGAADLGIPAGPEPATRESAFSACRDEEVAFERDGQGDYTRFAMQAIEQGVDGLTNAAFLERVRGLFGPAAEQNPGLFDGESTGTRSFLVPLPVGAAR